MADNNVLTNPMLSFMLMQNPAEAMQLQQQQALAAQLMQQASAPIDTANRSTGRLIAPVSPLEALAKAGQGAAAGYMQKQNNQKYADMLSGGSPSQPALDASMSNGQGPTTANDQTLRTVSGNSPSSAGLPSLTGDPRKDMMLYLMDKEAYTKGVVDSYGKTPDQKNWNDNAGLADSLHKEAIVKGLIKGGQDYINLPPAVNKPTPIIPPTANLTPPSPSGIATQLQATGSNALPNGQPDTAATIYEPTTPTPKASPATAVDKNSSSALAGEKSEAEKGGENLAEAQKTFNVTLSNLPRALTRFDELRKASADASSGYGIDESGEGAKQTFAQSSAGQFIEPKTATANQTIQQASKQGIIAELGPQLVGMRPNKFLESIATGASGLNAADPPQTKINAVNGLQDQYVASLKSIANQIRSYGGKAPSEAEIDAEVAKAMPGNNGVSPKIIKYDAQGKRM